MDNNFSLADIKSVVGDGHDGLCGNSAWVLILLFAMIFGGNGFFGGNNTSQQDAFLNTNFENISRNIQSVSDRQYEQANNLTKGISELGYTMGQQFSNLQTNIGGAIVSEGRATQQALCDVKSAVHSEGEATRNMLQQNKIESLQAKVTELSNQLGLQNAMCGVPKVNPYMYGIQPNCGCGAT